MIFLYYQINVMRIVIKSMKQSEEDRFYFVGDVNFVFVLDKVINGLK